MIIHRSFLERIYFHEDSWRSQCYLLLSPLLDPDLSRWGFLKVKMVYLDILRLLSDVEKGLLLWSYSFHQVRLYRLLSSPRPLPFRVSLEVLLHLLEQVNIPELLLVLNPLLKQLLLYGSCPQSLIGGIYYFSSLGRSLVSLTSESPLRRLRLLDPKPPTPSRPVTVLNALRISMCVPARSLLILTIQ